MFENSFVSININEIVMWVSERCRVMMEVWILSIVIFMVLIFVGVSGNVFVIYIYWKNLLFCFWFFYFIFWLVFFDINVIIMIGIFFIL